jgi:hypothetical protein
LNGPLILHGLGLEGLVLGAAGQVAAVVLDGGHVPESALGHAVVGNLKKIEAKL